LYKLVMLDVDFACVITFEALLLNLSRLSI
jgi:hypothetical protein